MLNKSIESLTKDAITLLKTLIATESFSGQEQDSADLIENFLQEQGLETHRKFNNIWACNKHYDPQLPTILLNSHHDTVKPNASWTIDPFKPQVKNGKLFGLGSNDAGGPLVSLIAVFLYFYGQQRLPFNLVLAAAAEEENSGKNGVECLLDDFGRVNLAIVGEPTEMNLAIAEKGLMVLDCIAKGVSGHAARDTGVNAIDIALKNIHWFHSYKFPKESQFLGPIKMTVTMIEGGIQHNIIPDVCHFTVDVRTTDAYSNAEALKIIQAQADCEVRPRSLRLNASKTGEDHPLVKAALKIGLKTFGSPTTSDQAVINAPSVKIGPGKSERSHTANEYIYIEEIRQGIETYINLLKHFDYNFGKI